MTTAVSIVLSTVVALAIAWAIGRPAARPVVARALWLVGVLAAAAAALAGDERSLEVGHPFAAYVGHAIQMKRFAIETVTAPGWAWGLVVLAFCALWAIALGRVRAFHPFWGPLLLGWSAIVLVLALEKTAAPAGLVEPLGFERMLFPASVAAAVLLARACRRVFLALCWLSLFVTMSRLPLAVLGTLLTQQRAGTSLDVHSITLFANPLAEEPVEVVAGSSAQLAWLIWAPNLLIVPALYMMSLGGVAFAVTMFVLHPPGSDHQPRQP